MPILTFCSTFVSDSTRQHLSLRCIYRANLVWHNSALQNHIAAWHQSQCSALEGLGASGGRWKGVTAYFPGSTELILWNCTMRNMHHHLCWSNSLWNNLRSLQILLSRFSWIFRYRRGSPFLPLLQLLWNVAWRNPLIALSGRYTQSQWLCDLVTSYTNCISCYSAPANP